MRIYVIFNNEEGTEATVELRPSWLRRLFGGQSMFGVIERVETSAYGTQWKWQDTGRDVSERIVRAIEVRPKVVIDFEQARARGIVPRCDLPIARTVER